MKKIHLSRILARCSQNLAESENLILNLYEDYKDGKIQACKTRKLYAIYRYNFAIDARRYNSILAACQTEDPDKYRYFKTVDYCYYDTDFNYNA